MMSPKTALQAILRFSSKVRWKVHGRNAKSFAFLLHASQDAREVTTWMSRHGRSGRSFPYGFVSMGLIGLSSLTYYVMKNKLDCFSGHDPNEEEIKKVNAGRYIKQLPTYKMAEVEQHNAKEKRIWVTYKSGVYDVTEFVDMHPGGDKILMAAGSSIEPFWQLYGVHNSAEVHMMLEEFRIGNLDHEESKKMHLLAQASDPYAMEPKRHPVIVPTSRKPFNGEPPGNLLAENFITPNSIFYIRNHLPVPVVDPVEFKLEVTGLGVKPRSFTLDQIKKFPRHTVTAAVQCAGNRRSDMTAVKPVKGLNWNQSAIGNAEWTGARLSDVLEACHYRYDPKIEHVHFEGLDKGPEDLPYAASVPAHKVLNPASDVILAYEMNGEELPRDHGYPLRAIVPGIVGARNVKWLTKVVLAEQECDSHWQRNDYKSFSPSTDWDTVDFTSAPAIQDLPVNSAICSPANGDTVSAVDGKIYVKGWAWAGGGRPIVRVDVTSDQGKTWNTAELQHSPDKASRRWAWTLWRVEVPVDHESEEVELWVKATDDAYNTQPETFFHIWNLRGLLANAYHKITVKLGG